MLFNSLHFVAFLPLVLAVSAALPSRARGPWLLLSSYYFYACWRVEYLGLILISTAVDYTVGILLGRTSGRVARRSLLACSLVANLGLLGAFKYYNFLAESANGFLADLGLRWNAPYLDVLLPVGISFYTFQTLSYTIDVYRGKLDPEKNILLFALYVSFFPQLVAGPIERATSLLPQLRGPFRPGTGTTETGLALILFGFFKKLVIADRLAIAVDAVYSDPFGHSGVVVAIATYAFAFQIYCDFSGYSDIAIGCARLLGVDLMTNFRQPYFAASLSEFWGRWHISLSTWFRDYLYIPLGGNRFGDLRRRANVLVVFLVSGAWHGANWTFLMWGAIHGLVVSVESLFPRRFPRSRGPLVRAIQTLVTFQVVCVSWTFFRASTVQEGVYLAMRFLWPFGGGDFAPSIPALGSLLGLSGYQLLWAVSSVAALVVIDFFHRSRSFSDWYPGLSPGCRALLVGFLLFSISHGGMFHSPSQFLYFQF